MKSISFWYKLLVQVDFFKNGINPAATVVKKWLWQVRKIFIFCIFAIPQYRENAAGEEVWQFVFFQCPEKSGWWKNCKNHIHEIIIFLVVFLFFKRDSYIFFASRNIWKLSPLFQLTFLDKNWKFCHEVMVIVKRWFFGINIQKVHESTRKQRAQSRWDFFQLMGHEPDWSYIHQISLTRKPIFDKIVSTEFFFWKIQAGSSIEFWISRSTKY